VTSESINLGRIPRQDSIVSPVPLSINYSRRRSTTAAGAQLQPQALNYSRRRSTTAAGAQCEPSTSPQRAQGHFPAMKNSNTTVFPTQAERTLIRHAIDQA